MYRYLLLLIVWCHTQPVSAQSPAPVKLITCEGKAQGTYYIVKYLATDTTSLQGAVDSIFQVIDQSLSLYRPGSLINQFNATGQVQLDTHMKAVVTKALLTSRATDGLFDITVKPLVDLWGFGVHKRAFTGVPPADSIKKALTYIGYRYLRIKGNQLLATRRGVQIDCNGIAQGYTVDVLGQLLTQRGIRNYLVDVGGELCASGHNARGESWGVGIERPTPGDTNYEPVQGMVRLPGKGIATSGNYRRFFDQGGTRFAHTIHPLTGEALHNHIISVTVMAKDCFTADAFDNPLILMGVEEGLLYIEQHPAYGLEAMYIYKAPDGTVKEACSKGFRQYMVY
ncbi:FAD:protein FMN transferase [Chitinophaga nivalis]|uniref:FAD:protein FMN transferase n=1 Tax=Chitinophaga nivalis TaxID=2991709 RepID=A0ABT3IG61_9BACT|nr:FAD:protein FMN transferase [Chitinophaga nivalis]MCW3467372.1 FAD:protein FMN transferase [Chitinophaga nivalis]MCW3482936.1 FAD:protein FMN transferase [Chitinophaga nivalis]